MSRSFFVFGSLLFSLVACGSVFTPALPDLPSNHQNIDSSVLKNATYTLSDSAVRNLLTIAGQNFTVRLRGGTYEFPDAFRMQTFTRVRLLPEPQAIGDLNEDGRKDIVVVLQIGEGESSVSELAVLLSASGSLHQVASFPLGHATVSSLRIQNGTVYAYTLRRLPQDLGPRKKEFTFRLPTSLRSGSGAIRP